MEFNKLVLAGVSVGCLAAAAGGSYLAVRQNQTASASSATGAANATTAPGEPLAGAPVAPVTESEGVIAPDAAPPVHPDVAPAPSRRETAIAKAPVTSSRASRSNTAERNATRPAPSNNTRVTTREGSRPSSTVARSGHATESAPAPPSSSSGSMWETRPSVQPSTPDYRDPEPPAPVAPPAPEFVEVTVPSDAVLGLQIERTVSSELARIEDRVDARVTRDVRVSDRVAIPAGSTVRGSVTEVDRGGHMKGKARLAIRFHTIVLADGTQVALKTDPVVREGQSPGGESAAKVGGAAIGGAILGAILGGGKGAAIGGAVGAGAGTAAAMSNDRNPATLAAGTTVTVRMQAPVTVTIQKD
ncbi:MAG TPA: hypothetical protein VM096_08765 [Vicinamibacterales bacterium]|nr:hypothetical protein [Vicinamibacterales bacterium]